MCFSHFTEATPYQWGTMSRNGVPWSGLSWRNRFLDAGRQSLADRVPGGPSRNGGSGEERRLRLENGHLKMVLAEATVQLGMWQKGAEYTDQVPSATSKP
jgi:transposase